MSPSLSFNDILEVSRPEIDKLAQMAEPSAQTGTKEAEAAFALQVSLVEGSVVYAYGLAAKFSRQADNPADAAEFWGLASRFIQSTLNVLHPGVGALGLYDKMLDYKLAADKRYRGAMEEAACLKEDFPKGLLPEMN